MAVTFHVSAYGQQSTEEQLALFCVLTKADLMPAGCSALEFEAQGIVTDGRYAVLIDRTHARWLQQRDSTASAWRRVSVSTVS